MTAEDGEGAGEARSSGDGTEWGKGIKKCGVGGNLDFPGGLLNIVCGICVSECMVAGKLRARRSGVGNLRYLVLVY